MWRILAGSDPRDGGGGERAGYFKKRLVVLSARTLPAVWQVGSLVMLGTVIVRLLLGGRRW